MVSLEIDNNAEFPLWNTSDSSILTFCGLLSCFKKIDPKQPAAFRELSESVNVLFSF